MSYITGLQALKAYGASRADEEALLARTTEDGDEQVRIAENSTNRKVLLNLALNKNLEDEAVQELFDRNLDYLTTRLESIGYEKKNFVEKLFS